MSTNSVAVRKDYFFGKGEDMLKLSKFDPDSLKPGRLCLFVARRGSGKSVLMRDLMSHAKEQYDLVIAMTPTEDSACFFRKHLPPGCVHESGFVPSVVESALSLQRASTKAGKRLRNLLLVLDDCTYDPQIFKSTAMRDLAMNGRHQKISLWTSCQYLVDLPPAIRGQIDYVFAFHEPVLDNRKKLHKMFFGVLPYPKFCTAMDVATDSYGSLVLDNTIPRTDPADCLFWYKADPELPKFHMCKQIYWKMRQAQQEIKVVE